MNQCGFILILFVCLFVCGGWYNLCCVSASLPGVYIHVSFRSLWLTSTTLKRSSSSSSGGMGSLGGAVFFLMVWPNVGLTPASVPSGCSKLPAAFPITAFLRNSRIPNSFDHSQWRFPEFLACSQFALSITLCDSTILDSQLSPEQGWNHVF